MTHMGFVLRAHRIPDNYAVVNVNAVSLLFLCMLIDTHRDSLQNGHDNEAQA